MTGWILKQPVDLVYILYVCKRGGDIAGSLKPLCREGVPPASTLESWTEYYSCPNNKEKQMNYLFSNPWESWSYRASKPNFQGNTVLAKGVGMGAQVS